MRWRTFGLCLVVIVGATYCGRFARADDDEAAKKDAAAKRLAAMKEEIDRFSLTVGDGQTKKLVRLKEPIQRWNNSIVPVVDAAVFLWTCEGRPAVVAQLAEVPKRGLLLEAHSLTAEALSGQFRQKRWVPTPEVGILDGALFSFALGTDPEVIILVESQKEKGNDTGKVAFARMTGYASESKLDGKEIWSCGFDHPYPPTSAFFQS